MLNGGTICYCFNVSRKRIRQAIVDHRCRTVEDVSAHTQACLGCRTCRPDIEAIVKDVWRRELREEPPATSTSTGTPR